MRLIISLVLLSISMTACGGTGGGTPSPTSVGEAIKAAEEAGTTPKLNRDDTIAGPDTDGNGVRDDIDAYIASLSDTEPQKAALRQSSAVLTKAMTVDITNQSAALEVGRQIMASVSCVSSKYGQEIKTKKIEIWKS